MKLVKKSGCTKIAIGEQDQCLVIASSGHGKTLAVERIAEQYFEKGYTVICLPSPKQNLELGYVGFKPIADYHLKKIKYQREEPTTHNFKLYHPFCTNIPIKRKIPGFELFTLDIKKIDRFLNYFLFENSQESTSLNLLLNTLTSLKKNEGLFDLVNKLKIRIKKKKSQNTFGVVASTGTQTTLNTIISSYSRFNHNPILFPSDFKFNLNMEKILKDNKHYHIFTNRYVIDKKIQDFITLYLLNEIKRVKEEGKAKHPIIIIMEELKTFCPNDPIYDFKKILNKLIAELISVCRGLEINFLASSQIYNAIDSGVRQSFNELILGKMSALQDLYDISKVIQIPINDRREITALKQNHFYLLSQEDGVDAGTYLIHLPKHMHQERGYVFDKMFAQNYPERMKILNDDVKYIKNDWKEQLNRAKTA